MLLTITYAGFLPLPLVGYGVLLHFSVAMLLKIQFACHRSRMTAGGIAFFYDVLTCVRKLAPIAALQTQHFSRKRGAAND